MNSKRIKLWIVLSLVSLTLLGSTACGSQTNEVPPEPARSGRSDKVVSVTGDGNLSLPHQRNLTFGTSGTIAEIKVEEGQRVTSGQVLGKLETAPLERAVKTAELAIISAEADRQQAEAGVLSAQAGVKQAEAGIKTAEADVKQAENGVQTAESSLKQAENAVKTAEATREQAMNTFRQITYPYTYSTFALDIPQALDYISNAERQVAEAKERLQAGLTPDQYAEALRQLQASLDNLVNARQRLSRGQGEDVFTSGLLTVGDFWTLRDAQLQVDKAQLALDTANVTLIASQLAVDTAKSLSLQAQLSVEVARGTLDKARAALTNAEGTLSKARLGGDKAKYELETARETLAKAIITAPFDGVIARVHVKVGDVLTPVDYTRTIFNLVDINRMELKTEVDEIDIPLVRVGQRAIIGIDALPDVQIEGKVTFISPLATIAAGVVMYEVKISFDVPEGYALRDGMSASAKIIVE